MRDVQSRKHQYCTGWESMRGSGTIPCGRLRVKGRTARSDMELVKGTPCSILAIAVALSATQSPLTGRHAVRGTRHTPACAPRGVRQSFTLGFRQAKGHIHKHVLVRETLSTLTLAACALAATFASAGSIPHGVQLCARRWILGTSCRLAVRGMLVLVVFDCVGATNHLSSLCFRLGYCRAAWCFTVPRCL